MCIENMDLFLFVGMITIMQRISACSLITVFIDIQFYQIFSIEFIDYIIFADLLELLKRFSTEHVECRTLLAES